MYFFNLNAQHFESTVWWDIADNILWHQKKHHRNLPNLKLNGPLRHGASAWNSYRRGISSHRSGVQGTGPWWGSRLKNQWGNDVTQHQRHQTDLSMFPKDKNILVMSCIFTLQRLQAEASCEILSNWLLNKILGPKIYRPQQSPVQGVRMAHMYPTCGYWRPSLGPFCSWPKHYYSHFQAVRRTFFDLLPSQYPFPLPSWNLDRVAGRLSPACKSVQDLLALAIASSQLHSFNVRSDGSYDLSLPAFDQQLPGEEVQLLLQTCEGLAVHYANLASKLLFFQLLCPAPTGPAGPGTCMDDGDHDPLGREGSFCQGVGLPREEPFEAGLGISEVHFRATARMERLLSTFCHRVGNNWGDLQMLADRAAEEVRSFLDHAFQSLSVMQGLPAIPPLDEFLLSAGAPVFYHAPIAGERWHVLQHILSTFSSADRARGLRVAEVGVEKGMTITYLMKHEKAIAEYVAVDPWHIPGKSEESNAILAAYHENLQAWSREEEAFQRHGQSAVRIIRKASEEAAGFGWNRLLRFGFHWRWPHLWSSQTRYPGVEAKSAAQWRSHGRTRLLAVPPSGILGCCGWMQCKKQWCGAFSIASRGWKTHHSFICRFCMVGCQVMRLAIEHVSVLLLNILWVIPELFSSVWCWCWSMLVVWCYALAQWHHRMTVVVLELHKGTSVDRRWSELEHFRSWKLKSLQWRRNQNQAPFHNEFLPWLMIFHIFLQRVPASAECLAEVSDLKSYHSEEVRSRVPSGLGSSGILTAGWSRSALNWVSVLAVRRTVTTWYGSHVHHPDPDPHPHPPGVFLFPKYPRWNFPYKMIELEFRIKT